MLKKILIRNIKNVTGDFNLGPVTVLRGPNESGKSGVLEAIRLAITGKAKIGGQGKSIQEIVNGDSGTAIAIHDGGSSRWSCKKGDSVSCKHEVDLDTQGKIPVTPKDFWDLSSAQQFSLLAGNAICEIVRDIELLKEKIKAEKLVIARPAPVMPEPYRGVPKSDLEKELASLNMELHKHNEASVEAPKRKASMEKDETLICELKLEAGGLMHCIEIMKKTEAELSSKYARLEALVNHYKEAIKTEPKMVTWARSSKMDVKGFVNEFRTKLAGACMWLADGASRESKHLLEKELRICAETLNRITVEHTADLPNVMFDQENDLKEACAGKTPETALTALWAEVGTARYDLSIESNKLEKIRARIRDLEHGLSLCIVSFGEPLQADVLDSILTRKTEIKEALTACDAWTSYDSQAGQHVVARSQAQMRMEEHEGTLDILNTRRKKTVMSITEPIERMASIILNGAGLPGLVIAIQATPKTASLEVRTVKGIHLDALAGSRRVVYDIALLSAIQEASSATSPVLLAECAECSAESFDSLLMALCATNSRRGSIVLEHHIETATYGATVVDMGVPAAVVAA